MSTDQKVSIDQNVWIDQHCHLPDDLDDAALVVEEARAADVVALVDVGCDVAGSVAAIERAGRFDMVSATAGVHPHEARHGIDGLAELLDRPEVVAVGECGLDYHYDHSPHEDQRRDQAQGGWWWRTDYHTSFMHKPIPKQTVNFSQICEIAPSILPSQCLVLSDDAP